jgi:hypothetical protein
MSDGSRITRLTGQEVPSLYSHPVMKLRAIPEKWMRVRGVVGGDGDGLDFGAVVGRC